MKTTVAIVLLAVVMVAYADDASNETVTTTARIVGVPEVRTEPPHGPLALFVGEKVDGVIEPGDVIAILSANEYRGFKGVHIWYQFAPPRTIDGVDGTLWAYGGVSKEGATPETLTIQASPKP